jgi:hypothetical protein
MPAMPPGVYTLRATLTGFRTLERKDIQVQVGSANRIAITLEVGQLTEVVEIKVGIVFRLSSCLILVRTSRPSILGRFKSNNMRSGRGACA